MLFIQDHPAARGLVVATVIAAVVTESWATYRGHSFSASSAGARVQNLGESVLTTLVPGNRGNAATVDRGTKHVLVLGTFAGGAVAVLIASRLPAARWGSNNWFDVILGSAIALTGIAVRSWAVTTLGRYFQREVVIEVGQTIIRSGPYRWVRHPAYAGNLLMLFGLGLAVGSWLGAALGTAIALVAHLPRIAVEESALRNAFAESYTSYAATTSRVVPGVW